MKGASQQWQEARRGRRSTGRQMSVPDFSPLCTIGQVFSKDRKATIIIDTAGRVGEHCEARERREPLHRHNNTMGHYIGGRLCNEAYVPNLMRQGSLQAANGAERGPMQGGEALQEPAHVHHGAYPEFDMVACRNRR